MLIALCVYLFKKYIYQSLRDQIAQKCVFIRGLENKMTALERQKDELHVQIVQQQTKCKKLMQDIAVWQQAVIHEQEKAEKERQASADEQSKRVAVQTAYLEAERLRVWCYLRQLAMLKNSYIFFFRNLMPDVFLLKIFLLNYSKVCINSEVHNEWKQKLHCTEVCCCICKCIWQTY